MFGIFKLSLDRGLVVLKARQKRQDALKNRIKQRLASGFYDNKNLIPGEEVYVWHPGAEMLIPAPKVSCPFHPFCMANNCAGPHACKFCERPGVNKVFRIRLRVRPRKLSETRYMAYGWLKNDLRNFYCTYLGFVPVGYRSLPAFYLDTKELVPCATTTSASNSSPTQQRTVPRRPITVSESVGSTSTLTSTKQDVSEIVTSLVSPWGRKLGAGD